MKANLVSGHQTKSSDLRARNFCEELTAARSILQWPGGKGCEKSSLVDRSRCPCRAPKSPNFNFPKSTDLLFDRNLFPYSFLQNKCYDRILMYCGARLSPSLIQSIVTIVQNFRPITFISTSNNNLHHSSSIPPKPTTKPRKGP